DQSFELCLTSRKCSGDLDVRLGYSLCREEQDFLQKRKKHVAAALKKILNLEEDLKEHEASHMVPNYNFSPAIKAWFTH
ncbi:UNVERIFIED_CONTAM: hypothetical protein H355_002769, partial [Colinus virginianus]